MSDGFLIIAQNGPSGDYLRMAVGLALSLHKTQRKTPSITLAVTPGMEVSPRERELFDHIVDIPWGDDAELATWKIHNKWKIAHLSPYDNTLLLDADMLFPTDIEDWWPCLKRHDLIITGVPHRYDGSRIVASAYREQFRFNDLPNVYTTCMFFKKEFAFFDAARTVFVNWDKMRDAFPGLPSKISGDLAFAVTAKMMGIDTTPNPAISFVHMKGQDQGLGSIGEDWNEYFPSYVRSDGSILVGNYLQTMPFHYAHKEFLTRDVMETLGWRHA